MQSCRDLIDVDGRPIGEWASPRYATVTTEEVACPYADARHGRPMNRTALRQLSSVWPEVLAAAGSFAGPDATVHRAWRAAIAATTAPAAHHAQLGTPIPRVLSALYKGGLGFSQVLTALLLAEDGVADAPLAELGDPDAFFAMLDTEGWLLGEVQACAGPATMIGQLLTVLAGSDAAPPSDLAALGIRWIQPAAEWIGLQVAFMGAARAAALRGSDPGEHLDPGAPWLRAVLATPGREASHALRLFPTGAAPPSILAFLAADSGTVEVLARRLANARRDLASDLGLR